MLITGLSFIFLLEFVILEPVMKPSVFRWDFYLIRILLVLSAFRFALRKWSDCTCFSKQRIKYFI